MAKKQIKRTSSSKTEKKPKKPSKEEVAEKKEESFRHRQFAREYVLRMGNGASAYRAIYGEDVKGADVSAARLLGNVRVQSIIEEEKKILETKYRTEVDEVIEYLFATVLMDPSCYLDEDLETGDQRLKLLRHMPLQARRTLLVSGKGKSVYFRQIDKEKAMELLNKFLGLENAGAGSRTGQDTGKAAIERIRKYLNRGSESK